MVDEDLLQIKKTNKSLFTEKRFTDFYQLIFFSIIQTWPNGSLICACRYP